MLEKRFLSEAVADIKQLPSRRLQELAISRILSIAKGEIEGRLLDKRVRTGDLSDCRKLYFDEHGGRNQGWRIVFRFLPTDSNRVVVEIIAVGRRANLEAYLEAAHRLHR